MYVFLVNFLFTYNKNLLSPPPQKKKIILTSRTILLRKQNV